MKNVRIELEKFVNVKGKIKLFGEKKPIVAPVTSKVLDILKLMVTHDKRVIIITDEELFHLKGIVVCSDVCSFFGGGDKCDLILDRSNCYTQLYERPITAIMTPEVTFLKDSVPLSKGVQIMTKGKIGTIPLVDKLGDLSGVITERHIVFLLADTNIDVKVKDIMITNVVTSTPDSTIGEILKQFCGYGFRRLPIVEKDKLVGYLTVKDIINYLVQDKVVQSIKKNDIDAVFNTKVSTIMSSPVITVSPEASINQFAQILKNHNIGAAPVVEDGNVVGIITERDIVKAMAFPPAK